MTSAESVTAGKAIISREQFFRKNEESALQMSRDADLQAKALEVFVKADQHRWIHQTTWLGEPLLNLPQDMFALQDIIWRTRPDFIVEVGVAWGGGMLFEATLLEILGGQKVIGIDVFIPQDLRERLAGHGALSERIVLVEGSSTSEETIAQLRHLIGDSRRVLVILDSNHTHAHVLSELRIYSQFIERGHYLVCSDTLVEYIPRQEHRGRDWGPGNSPATAVSEFLTETDRFEVDEIIEHRLLFSCHPGGYLVAVK